MAGSETVIRWSVIVPYFNEKDYLVGTLKGLVAQRGVGFRLILVDNGSDDGSEALARDFMRGHPDIEVVYLTETTKGKVAAMAAGARLVTTEFLAFCDADTFYPPHYLATADRLLREGGAGVVAALAVDIYAPPTARKGRSRLFWRTFISRILTWQTHTGGCGFCFRTAAFRAAGGYSQDIWPYVLEDHEVMNRILTQGRAVYDRDFWCMPSDRRGAQISWTLGERLRYHATPFSRQRAFFHEFLAARFAARQATALKLRERPWEAPPQRAGQS